MTTLENAKVAYPSVDERSTLNAQVCGRTLARAHARSGDPIALAAYMGKKDHLYPSITGFVKGYADQKERDYQAFAAAIRSGRLEALEGV